VGSSVKTLEIAIFGQSGRLYGPRGECWGGNVRAQSSHTLEGALIVFSFMGYPFHCPRKAPPLLLGVSGRQHHNWWGTGTGSGRLGH